MLEALFVGATDLLFAYLVFRIPSVYSVRTLFFKTCQHKSWRSQEFVEKGRLKVGPTKRRGAYAAMLVLSVPPVRTHCFFFGTNENRGIAPSQKEGTLTPRCPRTKTYRAVAKRKGAYAAMLVLSVFSVLSVRNPVFQGMPT